MNILSLGNFPSVDGLFTLPLSLENKLKKDGHNMFYIDFGDNTFFY